MPNRHIVTVTVLTVLAVLLASFTISTLWNDDFKSESKPSTEGPISRRAVYEILEPENPVRTERSNPEEERLVRLRVLSLEDGRPIASAEAFLVDPEKRTYEKARTLGRTNTEGKLQLDWNDDMKDLAVLIRAKKHCAKGIRHMVAGKTYEVSLPRAEGMTIFCHDLEGNPIEGIRIALSRASLPNDFEDLGTEDLDDVLPGADLAGAIFQGRSDKEGRVAFEDLATGSYTYACYHPSWGLSGASQEGSLATSTGPYNLTFGRLIGAVLERSDELVAMTTSGPILRELSSPLCSVSTRLAKMQLETRFPGHRAITKMIEVEPLEDAWPNLTLEVLTRDGRWHRGLLPLLPLEKVGLTLLDRLEPSGQVAMGELLLSLRSLDGREDLGKPEAIVLSHQEDPRIATFAIPGQVMRVPAGTYRIFHAGEPYLRIYAASESDSFVVEEGTRTKHTVQLKEVLRRCRLSLVTSGGLGIRHATLRCDDPKGVGAQLPFISTNSLEVTLPVGEIRLRGRVVGYEPIDEILSVRGDLPEGSIQEFRVELEYES